jgi:hypothetical protein
MRTVRIMPAVLLTGMIMAFASVSASRPAVPQQKMISVPAGTPILIRMLDTVDSSKNPPGSRFTATLETNLVVGSTVVVPKGNTVYGQLIESKQAGRATGSSELQLQLTSIVVKGTSYPVLTSDYEVKGSSSGKRTAKRLLGGAGLGAAFGAIGGNAGKGAAIGAGIGAVGSVVQKGKSVNVPSETLLEFRLQQPASLPAR